MGFLQGFTDGIKQKFQERQQRIKERKEFDDKLRHEQELLDRIEFEKQFKIKARQAAILRAERDAEKATGLTKIRAIKRAEAMKQGNESMFPKLTEYIEKTKLRREQNLERTAKLKEEATRQREERLSNKQQGLTDSGYKPFSDLNRLQ